MTEYEVEEVVDKKIQNGIELYYVKWKGYSEDQNTWEPKSHFNDIRFIEKYENSLNKNNIKKEKTTQKKKFETSSDSENSYISLKRNKNNKKKEEKNKKEDKKNIKNNKKDKKDKKEKDNKKNKKDKKDEKENNIKEGKLGINKILKIKHCFYNEENEKNPFFTIKFENEENQNFKDGIFEFEKLVKEVPELIARYLINKVTFTEKRKKLLND